jgi:hypothetical protein
VSVASATPLLWHWPTWTYAISWLWTNPVSYNFWSSAWGEHLFQAFMVLLLYLLFRPLFNRIKKHLECDITGCTNIGHPIAGTPYRACRTPGHHPAVVHKEGEPITAEHLKEAHALANPAHAARLEERVA